MELFYTCDVKNKYLCSTNFTLQEVHVYDMISCEENIDILMADTLSYN